MAKSKKKSLSLNSRGTLSRKQETSQTDLHNKIVLALEAPPASCGPTRSTRFEENPSIKALAGGSGPGKYLIYAEDGSGACGAASTTAEDHVAIEDCSDGEACDADQVDYPALEDGFGSGSKFFLSPTSNSGQSAPTSNPPCGKEISGTGVLHKEPSTLEGGLHAHSGTIKPLEHAIGKRRDLFTSNRSCADCPKLASTADGLSKQGAKDDAPNMTSRRSRVHARVGQAIVNAMQVLDPMQAEAELTAGCIKTTTSIGVTNKGAKGGEAASCDDVHASFDPDAEVPAMENIGRKAAGVQSLDPMHAEAEAMAEEWEKSKRQYMPRSRGLSAGGGPRASTQNSKGKEIAGGSVATPKARVFDGSS
ncbi:hypothetical protein H0E87_015000, partial [Populus deltoides]